RGGHGRAAAGQDHQCGQYRGDGGQRPGGRPTHGAHRSSSWSSFGSAVGRSPQVARQEAPEAWGLESLSPASASLACVLCEGTSWDGVAGPVEPSGVPSGSCSVTGASLAASAEVSALLRRRRRRHLPRRPPGAAPAAPVPARDSSASFSSVPAPSQVSASWPWPAEASGSSPDSSALSAASESSPDSSADSWLSSPDSSVPCQCSVWESSRALPAVPFTQDRKST